MALNKVKLGTLIEQVNEKNYLEELTKENIRGISTQKRFIKTLANLNNVSLKSYKIVQSGCFAYVPDTSRRNNKISLAYNDTNTSFLVSSISIVFKVKSNKLLDKYLYIYFCRKEFDRYARYNSWGSAREVFTFEDLSDIDFVIPPLEIQQKYINIYESLQNKLKVYESKLNKIELTFTATIENLKKQYKSEAIKKYIKRGPKNTNEKITNVIGIGQNGFILPQKKPNKSLKNYKIIKNKSICYAPPIYNILSDAIHLYRKNELAICSPIYEVINCDEEKLLAEYLIIWLKREEFKRYAQFYALGVRNTFDYELMEEFSIPIPNINIQKSIAQIYQSYYQRKILAEKINNIINDLYPLLIKGAIKEATENE